MVETGQVLQNRYLIQKQIGAGGMGTVYLATDKRLNSPVAIKETLFTDDELKRAFEREAQLLNSLRHPALPRVIDYFTEGDAQFLVMEYIAGEDLSALLKANGTFPVGEVLRWADELLDALAYLHSQKAPVIHRDIKPQNLKLTDKGEVILLDFGLAKGKPGDTSKLSKTNSVFGYSRSYAPLEQIQGTGTDPRSDLYSLTATLYHLLTGKPPTDALTRATAYVNEQSDPLIPIENFNPQVPLAVSQVLQQGLELNAALRPQSAAAMRDDLKRVAADLDERTTPKLSTSKAAAAPLPIIALAAPPAADEIDKHQSIEVAIPSRAEDVLPINADYPADYYEDAPRRIAWVKYVGIAVTILLLGGGSAAWYATSRQQTASESNVNQTAIVNTAVNKKTDAPNVNTKAAVSNTAAAANTQNTEPKVVETVNTNKNSPSKTATAAEAAPNQKQPEQQPVQKPDEEAPAPIVVKSAPPTAELIEEPNADEEKRKPEDEEPRDEEAEDKANRRRDRDDDPPRVRERRVKDNRRNRQRLPTILGAPPDN